MSITTSTGTYTPAVTYRQSDIYVDSGGVTRLVPGAKPRLAWKKNYGKPISLLGDPSGAMITAEQEAALREQSAPGDSLLGNPSKKKKSDQQSQNSTLMGNSTLLGA